VTDLGRIVCLHSQWQAVHDQTTTRCPGALRVFHEDAHMTCSTCDDCRFEIAFRREPRPAVEPDREAIPF